MFYRFVPAEEPEIQEASENNEQGPATLAIENDDEKDEHYVPSKKVASVYMPIVLGPIDDKKKRRSRMHHTVVS
jgi:hypothetical protein